MLFFLCSHETSWTATMAWWSRETKNKTSCISCQWQGKDSRSWAYEEYRILSKIARNSMQRGTRPFEHAHLSWLQKLQSISQDTVQHCSKTLSKKNQTDLCTPRFTDTRDASNLNWASTNKINTVCILRWSFLLEVAKIGSHPPQNTWEEVM